MFIKNTKLITKIVISFFISGLALNSVFANVDVTASIESGTYNKAIKVELNTTESWAKTFFGFNPDWSPWDLELYSWAIIIKKTTPLVFFSVISTTNESKIKINEYTINYPNDIKIWSWVFFDNGNLNNLWLVNNSSEDIDISYWILKNDSSNVTLPENSIIKSWWTYTIDWLSGTWIITLYSPDEEKKDSVDVIIPAPVVAKENTWTQENAITTENTIKSESKPVHVKKPYKPENNNPQSETSKPPVTDNNPTETKIESQNTSWENKDNNAVPASWDNTSTPSSDNQISGDTQSNPDSTPTWTSDNISPAPTTSTETDNSANDNLKTSVKDVSSWDSWNANFVIFWLLIFSLIWWIVFKIINSNKKWV